LEHEIFRKPLPVSADLFVEPLGGYAVEAGELGIEQDLVTAQSEDRVRDLLGRRRRRPPGELAQINPER
jgi:hypothetical protein